MVLPVAINGQQIEIDEFNKHLDVDVDKLDWKERTNAFIFFIFFRTKL